MKRILLYFTLLMIMSSCSNKSEQQIEEEISSGLVLIQNNSFYEVVLPNGESVYFSNIDNNGEVHGVAMEKDSVNIETSYGTGFIVSDRGEIATNAHVVSTMLTEKELNKSITSFLNGVKSVIKASYDKYNDQLETVETAYNYANYSDEVSYEEFYEVRDIRDALIKVRDQYKELLDSFSEIHANECEIKYHCEVGIAYNDTYVTDSNDFLPCVVVKSDPEHDVAIIQLKNKRTPADKYVFEIDENDPLEEYSLREKLTQLIGKDKNSRLFMASFNLGPTLALTDEGIKSQFNHGSISQKTNDRIMYSIPTLPGSSGSPVVNLCGQLVAVNYAGLSSTQNFNYGIRIKHLKNLLDR